MKDNLIIIGPSYLKRRVLKENSLKYSIKYIDEYELRDKYLYAYRDDTIVYLDKTYDIGISKIILDNLYDIEDKEYNSPKLNKLRDIKNDLINKGYIINNPKFKEYLKDKDILVLNNFFDKRIIKIIKELEKVNNLIYQDKETIFKDKIDVLECDTLEEEVILVASKICDLINEGVSINKIFVNTLSEDYRKVMIRVFNFYNIPNNFKTNTLYELLSVKKFINSISLDTKIIDINERLGELPETVANKVVSIFNKYVDYEEFKDIKKEVIYDLKHTSINLNTLEDAINEKDYKSYIPLDDEYIFILGTNEGEVPKTLVDDNYLKEDEAKELEISTYKELNSNIKNYFKYYINNVKNIYLSYKLKHNADMYVKNSIYDALDNINIIKGNYKYDNKKINEILLGKRLDNFIKYNEKASDLEILNNYETNYKDYSNKFKGIDLEVVKKQNSNINLAATSSNDFYKCKFNYLLKHIYKLDTFEETISQKIGLLYHAILCRYFKDKGNLDLIIDEEINKNTQILTNKDKFYIEKYKRILKDLINIIEEQLSHTKFKQSYFEKTIIIDNDNSLNIKIKGQIDKILTLEDGDNTYVIVIDYKTGVLHGLENAIYGINMQLAFYMYLIYNSKLIKNPKFAGMYLEQIMPDLINSKNGKTYSDLLKENSRLTGYTLKDINVVNNIDDSVSYLGGVTIRKDGELKDSKRLLDEDTFNKVMEVISSNIENAIKDINNLDFTINPKKLKNDNISCEFCPFKDICYMTNDDIVELDPELKKTFLGGDTNEDETE